MRLIRKVLIANRGEIACRIARTAKARGVATVAVYSDADKGALHVRGADEAEYIGRSPATESYLNIAAIIEAAKRAGADAVHPGYGFLSERADFAEACADAGLIFIGPPASAIAAMGDKAEARRRMVAAGVPCVPGYHGEDQSDARFAKEAKRLGYPVMVKAAAGGGGRGMRVVADSRQLKDALASARSEAAAAFGDGRLLLEKLVAGARHVEIQIFADAHGNVVHLGERDCSLQRRRQKVIEEAPSPVISANLRAPMGAAAVEVARAVGYRNAGTVEFLFDPSTKDFFFLEMNTRLQVEHPVTELVTGLDLVALQFDVAEGGPLPFRREEMRLDGWAIEARLYAEDPVQEFLPQTGRIARLEFPLGEGLRVDSAVEEGDVVSPFYDPLIAKVIAKGRTRDEARARLAEGLERMTLLGLTTNAAFLIALLRDETFAVGAADVGYIEGSLAAINAGAERPVDALDIALAAAGLIYAAPGPLLAGWNSRGATSFPLTLDHGGARIAARATVAGNFISGELGDARASIEVLANDARNLRFRIGGEIRTAAWARDGEAIEISRVGRRVRFVDLTYAPASVEAAGGADAVRAPLAGVVTSVAVKPGDRVEKGQTVATIEAMKMEHRLCAPRSGVVAEVFVRPGEQAALRAILVRLEGA
jgi:geranyl-CoA carboxylase alpha subunit